MIPKILPPEPDPLPAPEPQPVAHARPLSTGTRAHVAASAARRIESFQRCIAALASARRASAAWFAALLCRRFNDALALSSTESLVGPSNKPMRERYAVAIVSLSWSSPLNSAR